ncbi:MAG TPA: family 1 glycosylhydrolase, partial [Acidimicrobiales bacterium]|nr:family 1 glycosylhydrolase [Acidimicrobiales bacterium]
CARSHGVARDELPAYLAQRRDEFYASPAGVGVPGPTGPTRRYPGLENLLRRLAASQLPLASALPRSVDAVYGSAYECTLDVAQIDYYDPETASHLQLPGGRTAGGRMLLPFRPLWDDPPNPDGLIAHARANVVPGLDLWVVENGLCNRVRRGRSYPRLDGWDRPRYLRANLAAVVRAVSDGLPVTGYWHWCLADNYEWGSYEPRFGLYGVDRERGVRWSDLDSMGQDAAGAYRSIIEGLRSGDAAVIGES